MYDEFEQLPFHRKYRPASLVDYVGNTKIKSTVLSYLKEGNTRPQMVLLEGPSGGGKTSFGRLLVKEYLCEDRNDISGACGVCPACQEVTDYILTGEYDNLPYVTEVDIGEKGGKSDIDAVLEQASYPVMGGGWRVYLFDECHMASRSAQTRLLKIAEEPPENVLFIFCTTDPEKMLDTLLGRCQLRLKVVKPKVKELMNLLHSVCEAEGIPSDAKGLSLVSSRCDLTFRKALILLDQIAKERGSAKYQDVLTVLDEVSDTIMIDFYTRLLNRDVFGYVTLLHNVKTQMELKTFVHNLIDFTKRGLYIINGIVVDGMTEGEVKAYRKLFSQFSIDEISNLLSRLNDMEFQDPETKLLMMGYSGITSTKTDSEEVEDVLSVEAQESEIRRESESSTENTVKYFKELEDKGHENLEDLTAPAQLEDLIGVFGGTLVE